MLDYEYSTIVLPYFSKLHKSKSAWKAMQFFLRALVCLCIADTKVNSNTGNGYKYLQNMGIFITMSLGGTGCKATTEKK